jgi:hypothetical protein
VSQHQILLVAFVALYLLSPKALAEQGGQPVGTELPTCWKTSAQEFRRLYETIQRTSATQSTAYEGFANLWKQCPEAPFGYVGIALLEVSMGSTCSSCVEEARRRAIPQYGTDSTAVFVLGLLAEYERNVFPHCFSRPLAIVQSHEGVSPRLVRI